MVFLTISVKAYSSKRSELLSAYRTIAEKILQFKGCSGCQIFEDVENEKFINLEGVWESREYLDNHFRSDIFSALIGAVKLLSDTHEIRINECSQNEGLDAVKIARSN